MGVSAQLGRSTGDLLDQVVKLLRKEKYLAEISAEKKVAIIGKPNVGKSSFVNFLLGENRSIVTDVTRDDAGFRRFTSEISRSWNCTALILPVSGKKAR